MLLSNSYTWELYDKNDNLLLTKTYHNICMPKRLVGKTSSDIVIKIGIITERDELKFQDGEGNWLGEYVENKDGDRQDGKKIPTTKEITDSNGNKKVIKNNDYVLNPKPKVTDTSLFGTTVQSLHLKWSTDEDVFFNNQSAPKIFCMVGTGEWGYHRHSDSYNSLIVGTDENGNPLRPEDDKSNWSMYGVIIKDSGIYCGGTMISHVSHNDQQLLKRPTDKLKVTVRLYYYMPNILSEGYYFPGYLHNFKYFFPHSNRMYGHNINSIKYNLPQYYPQTYGFSNYPVQQSGSYCYPIVPQATSTGSYLTSPKINKSEYTLDGITTVEDEGWLEEEWGPWNGLPVFFYIGNLKQPDLPKTIEVPLKSSDIENLDFDIPPQYLAEQDYGVDAAIAPGYIWRQWLVETEIEERIEGKKLIRKRVPIVYYHYTVTTKIVTTVNGVVIESESSEEETTVISKTLLLEREEVIKEYGTKIITKTITRKPVRPNFMTIKLNLKEVKDRIYKTTYYNFDYLEPRNIDMSYYNIQGPMRSFILDGCCAETLISTNNKTFGTITLEIGVGDGVTNEFFHPFISESTSPWRSGTVVSAYCDSATVASITDYKPETNVFGNEFYIYDNDDLNNYVLKISGDNFIYGKTLGKIDPETGYYSYEPLVGYDQKQKVSYYNINPFTLKYCPTRDILLNTADYIVINQDILRGKTLHYALGGWTNMTIWRVNDLLNVGNSSSSSTYEKKTLSSSGGYSSTNLMHSYSVDFSDESYQYTVITGTGPVIGGTREWGVGGLSTRFFEPGGLRFSTDGDITGSVKFTNPPAKGSPVYITVNLYAPFFHKDAKANLKLLLKFGDKEWNGDTDIFNEGEEPKGPKEEWK